MLSFSAPFMLLAFSMAAAQSSAPPSAATGAAEAGSYHDNSLHLSYSVPGSYVDASAIVGPAFQASLGRQSAPAATKCISIPFSRMAADGETNIIMLLHADANCLKRKFDAAAVAELTQGEAQGVAASGAKTNFGKVTSFDLDHHSASALQGSFTLPTGQTLYSRVVCVLDQPDVACWQFLSGTPEGLAAMSVFPITFDGSTPHPLQVPDVGNPVAPTR